MATRPVLERDRFKPRCNTKVAFLTSNMLCAAALKVPQNPQVKSPWLPVLTTDTSHPSRSFFYSDTDPAEPQHISSSPCMCSCLGSRRVGQRFQDLIAVQSCLGLALASLVPYLCHVHAGGWARSRIRSSGVPPSERHSVSILIERSLRSKWNCRSIFHIPFHHPVQDDVTWSSNPWYMF